MFNEDINKLLFARLDDILLLGLQFNGNYGKIRTLTRRYIPFGSLTKCVVNHLFLIIWFNYLKILALRALFRVGTEEHHFGDGKFGVRVYCVARNPEFDMRNFDYTNPDGALCCQHIFVEAHGYLINSFK